MGLLERPVNWVTPVIRYLLTFWPVARTLSESRNPTRMADNSPSAIIAMAERCGGGGGAAERS